MLSRSAKTCGAADYFGWASAASASAAKTIAGGIPTALEGFTHRVLVLPSQISSWAGCTWAGLGTIGPAESDPIGTFGYGWVGTVQISKCRPGTYFEDSPPHALLYHPLLTCSYAWISGEHSRDLNAYFHEISHNLYLGELVPARTCKMKRGGRV